VINDSEGSSDDDEGAQPVAAQKGRTKMNNRVQSEMVSARVRKSAVIPSPITDDEPPEVGNLLGFDPFAPLPETKVVHASPSKTAANKVKNNNNKRTKISSSPVHDPKPLSASSLPPTFGAPNPFQSLTPVPFNLNPSMNQYNNYNTPFTPQVLSSSNPPALSGSNPSLSGSNPYMISQQVPNSQLAPNPFTSFPQIQAQGQQFPQPFYNAGQANFNASTQQTQFTGQATVPNFNASTQQTQFTGQATVSNTNPFMQMNNNNIFGGGFQSTNPVQGNIYFG